nr:MAG TPA: hypothetical protein [Caudoviricetes sp.]
MSVKIRIIRINCHALFVTIPFALGIVPVTVKTLAARRIRANIIEEVLPIHLRFAIQAHHRRSVLGPVEFIQAAVGAAHSVAVLITGSISYFLLHVYRANLHLAIGKPPVQKGAFGHRLFHPPSYQKICSAQFAHFFFVTPLILLNFFIVLNKRKNWETGQKCEKPLIFLGFLLPTFVLKTGQKVGRGPFSAFLAFRFSTKTGQKLASAHFLEYKTGQKPASELRLHQVSGGVFNLYNLTLRNGENDGIHAFVQYRII